MLVVEGRARILAISFIAVLSLSCSRDPEIAKREYLASGDQFLSQSKVKEAIVQYRNALRQDPRFGEARYKLAEALAQDGDTARAAREYVRAADLLPKDVQAQLKAGRILLLSGQFEDAKTRAHSALAIDRKNVEAQILLGNALAGLKDIDGGIEEIQEAIRLDPENSLGYVSLGAITQTAGRWAEAEAAFKKAVEADAKSVPAYLALANFYWAARKPVETALALQQAYKLDPDHPLINRMLALFQIATGKPADAEPFFKKLALVSKDTNAKIFLADYYIASGRSKEAVPLLQQLTSTKETRANSRLLGGAELRLAALDFQRGATRRGSEASRPTSEARAQQRGRFGPRGKRALCRGKARRGNRQAAGRRDCKSWPGRSAICPGTSVRGEARSRTGD